MQKLQNKKGFEMSINTIVILVIGVTMLILGIVLVRTIMCGAMTMAATTNEGAQAEINKLFSEENQEQISCLGLKTAIDIIPESQNIIGCGFKPGIETTYTYNYTIKYAIDANGESIKDEVEEDWILNLAEMKGTKTVGAGQTEYATFIITPPSNAPEGTIRVRIIVTTPREGTVADKDLTFNIKRLGMVQKGVC